ncbi:hypothetical protein A2U01_0072127, partial [Trifolium medium]|nr:hypothetical protein [Trifolium medium]
METLSGGFGGGGCSRMWLRDWKTEFRGGNQSGIDPPRSKHQRLLKLPYPNCSGTRNVLYGSCTVCDREDAIVGCCWY